LFPKHLGLHRGLIPKVASFKVLDSNGHGENALVMAKGSGVPDITGP